MKNLDVCKKVLTESEAKYLEGVIKPFREKVMSIKKINDITTEYIMILLNVGHEDNIVLPSFDEGEYYVHMVPEREYSLEELGL